MELLRTAPLPIHNNYYILRWYEWDLLVFCKQTPFYLGAIGTLKGKSISFRKWCYPKVRLSISNMAIIFIKKNNLKYFISNLIFAFSVQNKKPAFSSFLTMFSTLLQTNVIAISHITLLDKINPFPYNDTF